MQNVVILGATGSIGQSTLKVLRLHPERFRLFGVSAHRNLDKLAQICVEFRPAVAVVANAADVAELRTLMTAKLGQSAPSIDIHVGPEALVALARGAEVDTVVAAIVGAAGLPSTLAAAASGKRLLLANKESLVVGGALVSAAAARSGALILPIDSEHNALLQCLPPARPIGPNHGVAKLWLTASGGPFRSFSQAMLAEVTPEQACAHPVWQMGKKISVDSATLMNKGLEVIEAHWLFGLPAAQIDVVVHPQSIVHSLVEYVDGSFLAQLGSPDMCTPIAYALSYPDRINAGVTRLDPLTLSTLHFEAPDRTRFPCLQLAYDVLAAGPSAAVILNAANEVAVERFLNGALSFVGIAQLINECLQLSPIQSAAIGANNLADVLALDAWARVQASTLAATMRFD
jgi:1-deoxy-D-xylulose-5-phosphate reductoisomerase